VEEKMGVIRVLPEAVANKIAAGEVIERPASVVKELVENALDASATAIDITVENGGFRLIRVSDNGSGMAPEDAKLAFQRHATSKIISAEDLERIASLGFRGEALPSIAAVSRLKLQTRPEGKPGGVEITIEGGVGRGSREAACAQGTTVEVRDLFFNTPARRKFQKSDSTELGHILDTVSRLALPAFGVRFTLQSNGKKLFDYMPAPELSLRAAEVLGEEAASAMIPLEAAEGPLKLTGLIAKPILTRSTRSAIELFVNRRWVRSTPLSYGVLAGYHGLLMHGRYPVAVLFLETDLERVDVNVHPTKQEVRISREPEVAEFIKRSIKACLEGAKKIAPSLNLPPAYAGETPAKSYRLNAPPVSETREPAPSFSVASVLAPAPVTLAEPLALKEAFRITRILGQLHGTYIVAETEEGFILVDQHAAHERVVFEALLKGLRSGKAERQALLLDEVLDVPQKQLDLFKTAKPLLVRLGFEIEEFGPRSFVIRSYPAALGEIHPVRLLQSFLDEAEEGKLRSALDDHAETVAALCACKKSSVKAGDSMAPQAMRALLERLAGCENPYACPHGRPVFFSQTLSELEKQFKRI
jgi:DNA mismatch repair protein MutL